MSFRCIIVGLGIQGEKRLRFAGDDACGSVDPVHPAADFKRIEDVPLDRYDAALVCTPDEPKIALLEYLLEHQKHVLVEKPLIGDQAAIAHLRELADRRQVTCYTAYNHRFEPHFVRMREWLRSGAAGETYRVRMFYGNGTARDVRGSPWRDQAAGVLPDLGSHLLDTVLFWFGRPAGDFEVREANRFENRAFDHVVIASSGPPVIELEMTLLSWRNHFTADVLAEKGTAHIESLCKWGPSSFSTRTRVLPSGRPPEERITLVQSDPTWELEYAYFKDLCSRAQAGNLENDLWLSQVLSELSLAALGSFPE